MKARFILIFAVLLFSCNDSIESDQVSISFCDTTDPRNNIDWLKNKIESFPISVEQQVFGYIYKGQDVFLINDCFNCADALTIVYDCDGNEVCRFGGIAGFNTCPDFDKEAIGETLLFSSVKD